MLPASRSVRRLLAAIASGAWHGTRAGWARSEHKAHAMTDWAADVCRRCGIDVQLSGAPPPRGSLIVSNHRSYADPVVISASTVTRFVAKQEVAGWPLVG